MDDDGHSLILIPLDTGGQQWNPMDNAAALTILGAGEKGMIMIPADMRTRRSVHTACRPCGRVSESNYRTALATLSPIPQIWGTLGEWQFRKRYCRRRRRKVYRIYKGHVIVDAEYDSFWDLWVNPKLNPFLFVVITEKLIKFSL